MRHPIVFEQPEEDQNSTREACLRHEAAVLRWWLTSVIIMMLTLLLVTGIVLLFLTHTLPLYFALFAGLIFILISILLAVPASAELWRAQPVPQAVAVNYIVGENGEMIPQVESDPAVDPVAQFKQLQPPARLK